MVPNAPADTAPSAPVVPPVEDNFPLTLTEFCTRFSATEKRVELLGGFFYDERSNGREKDTEANYTARFSAFANRPTR